MNEKLNLIPQLDIFKQSTVCVLEHPNNPMFNRYEHHGAQFVEISKDNDVKYWYVITLKNQTVNDAFSCFVLSDAKLQHWRNTDFNNVIFWQEGTLNFYACSKENFKEMCRFTEEYEYEYERYDYRAKSNNKKIKRSVNTSAHIIKVDYKKLEPQFLNGEYETIKKFDLSKRMSWRPKSNIKCRIYVNGVEKQYDSIKDAHISIYDACNKMGLKFVEYRAFVKHFHNKKEIKINDSLSISFAETALPKANIDARNRALSISSCYNNRYTECTAKAVASIDASEKQNNRLEELEQKYEKTFNLSKKELDELTNLRKKLNKYE